VIVPSYGPGHELSQQLAAIAGQDYLGPVEIIVAYNGSPAWKRHHLETHANLPVRARLVNATARRGPSAARNAGVKAARGDFLAFCDADDLVSREWLRLLVQDAGEADLVGGSLDSVRLNAPSLCACYELTDPAAPHLRFLPAAAGANLGIWREAFEALGGFDERTRTAEDVALVWSAQLKGYVYRPSAALVHKRLPSSRFVAARRFFHYGIGDAWLYRAFRMAGMPRRDSAETRQLGVALVRGFAGVSPDVRWCRWNLTLWLTGGRFVGSVRYRVLFT
jgi:GT2 family glycosyltransferase